ncbi:hypothetical protein K402DRAFT_414288 [Aulographum hederae CBS 113979]|uniref:C2H2-type domain-containing protein n=1 Tax=Aulographum hederae CBS 113979 TaxID=1176131 RepID=A0A6G1GRR0_9PEZI|nr:hypothetical protein K402DRAFT_414288 [Aulographum hederae CBS 113979]
MDGRQTDFPQSGLSPPFQVLQDHNSEDSSADQASAAQYPQQQGQDPRSANSSSFATPTSEYGLGPSSARSGSFPDYIQRNSYPPQGQAPNAGGMAQPTSPSLPLSDGPANDAHSNIKSDPELPIDPSIAATSPTYSHHPQYSPYGQQSHEMQHYAGHPGVYGRPEWAGGQYPAHHIAGYGQHPGTSGPPAPAMVSPVQRPPNGGHPLSTVYSFVPIPGAQQHKRPRRRYEEIERMYKCGWNGCEKAYGTLNHLNAHVTMQSHGTKRTPEEFKEIRKEWKAKKKEEEAQRKADEDRQRQGGDPRGDNGEGGPVYGMRPAPIAAPPNMPNAHLPPPMGYTPASSQAPTQYGEHSPTLDGVAQYSNGNSFPQSPYGQNAPMYQQHNESSSSFQQ